jgi:hypothetical protein
VDGLDDDPSCFFDPVVEFGDLLQSALLVQSGRVASASRWTSRLFLALVHSNSCY